MAKEGKEDRPQTFDPEGRPTKDRDADADLSELMEDIAIIKTTNENLSQMMKDMQTTMTEMKDLMAGMGELG